MRHLLYLVHRIPYPPDKGDKVRSYNLLRHLASRYKVHLGAFVDDPTDFQHRAPVAKLCEDCHLVKLDPRIAKLRSLTGLLTGEALTLPYYRSASMALWVQRTLEVAPIEGVVAFSSAMAQYAMFAGGLRRIADLVDVDSDKWRQYAATRPWPLSAIYRRESRALLAYERRIAREFDASVLVCAAEADLFRRLAPESAKKTWHAKNGVDAEYFSPQRVYPNPYVPEERVIVFTGAMDYWPNVDAVEHFARALFPDIYAAVPASRFFVVGARPAAQVLALARLPGVTVTGGVADIRPYIAHAQVAVAPLRVARGVQNKVLEAMAMGKTVVASLAAAQGIEAERDRELLVANDDRAFVDQVRSVLGGKTQTGEAARNRVLASYLWDGNLQVFDRLLSGPSRESAARPPRQAAWDSR